MANTGVGAPTQALVGYGRELPDNTIASMRATSFWCGEKILQKTWHFNQLDTGSPSLFTCGRGQ